MSETLAAEIARRAAVTENTIRVDPNGLIQMRAEWTCSTCGRPSFEPLREDWTCETCRTRAEIGWRA